MADMADVEEWGTWGDIEDMGVVSPAPRHEPIEGGAVETRDS
jgi:hypothetical protein